MLRLSKHDSTNILKSPITQAQGDLEFFCESRYNYLNKYNSLISIITQCHAELVEA